MPRDRGVLQKFRGEKQKKKNLGITFLNAPKRGVDRELGKGRVGGDLGASSAVYQYWRTRERIGARGIL